MTNKNLVKYSNNFQNLSEKILLNESKNNTEIELTEYEFKYCILFLLLVEAFYNKLIILQNPNLKSTTIIGQDLMLLLFLEKYLQNI